MTLQLLSALPIWLSALLVVALPTLVAIVLSHTVRRAVGLERLVENNEVAGFKFAVVGVIYAVMLGFAVIVVWEKFHEAEAAATREAGALVSLYRLSTGLFGPPQAAGQQGEVAALRDQLTGYARAVVDLEWPAMERGGFSREAREKLDAIYRAVLLDDTQDRASAVVLSAVYRQLDVVTQARRERLRLAAGVMPGVLWAALLMGAGCTIGYTLFFGARHARAQALMTGVLTLLICMGLLVIVSIDHPFTGPVSVSPEALRAVLDDFGGAG